MLTEPMEIGATYRLYDGREYVCEPNYGGSGLYPYALGEETYTEDGVWWIDASEDHHLNVACRVDAPEPEAEEEWHPTTNTLPMCFLTDDQRRALKEWPHGVEMLRSDGSWGYLGAPKFLSGAVYRGKPAPKRRTVVMYGHTHPAYPWSFRATMTTFDTHKLTFEEDEYGKPICGTEKLEKM